MQTPALYWRRVGERAVSDIVSQLRNDPASVALELDAADEIERLRAALANEQARGVHTCHEHCERPMCVMQRAITERDSTIERLRARLAEAERDAARYRWLREVFSWNDRLRTRFDASIDAAIDAAMGKP
jgi:hypothetical protein